MQITLDLPFPPSTNRLWRHSRGRTHISSEYKLWISRADALFMTQKRGPIKMLMGKFDSILYLARQTRQNADSDNRIKAVLDYCVRIGLIQDDKFHEWGQYGWVIPEAAPHGCRVTLLTSKRNR